MLVNLHKMQSIVVGLRQSGIGIKYPGIIPEELLSSGLLSTDPRKNDAVCLLACTKLDRQIIAAFLEISNFFDIYSCVQCNITVVWFQIPYVIFQGQHKVLFILKLRMKEKLLENTYFTLFKRSWHFNFLGGGWEKGDKTWGGKKLIILGVPSLGANPKHWHKSIHYNWISENNNFRNLCIIDAGWSYQCSTWFELFCFKITWLKIREN